MCVWGGGGGGGGKGWGALGSPSQKFENYDVIITSTATIYNTITKCSKIIGLVAAESDVSCSCICPEFHENLQTLVSVSTCTCARIDISPSQEKLLYAACSEQEHIRTGD